MKGWAAVARLGGIGDNLIAASVCRPLKRCGYNVEVITGAPNHVLFHHNPFIDKLAVKEEKDLPQGDMAKWQEWFLSRANEYDIFAHLSHSCESRHALFPHMTPFWWPQDYRRKICAGSYLETVHDIAGMPYEFGPLFFTSEDEKINAQSQKATMGNRLIGWVLSGTRIDKVYPYAPMAIGRIIRELNAPVMLMGGAHEKEWTMAQAIKDHVERQNGTRDGLYIAVVDPSWPTEKKWGIRSSLALLQSCDLVVTPDTGPAWSVAFEPMPKIALVSHASAENITKHWINTTTLHADPERVPCWPCHRLHNDPATCKPNKENNGAACMSDISVERLYQAVEQIWRGPSAVVKPLRPMHIVKETWLGDGKLRIADDQHNIVATLEHGSAHLADEVVKRLNG